jgi:isopentenyl diphosphate isomerase/L-lactate dehydrogenase-like FMN-dependent dehydrogenase
LYPLWHKRAYSVNAMREMAHKQLPQSVFDFADGGADDEKTLRLNESAFDQYVLLPRPLNGAPKRDLSVNLFGKSLKLPVIIGPTGLSGLFWPNGECETAKAAHAAGTAFCLSHGSTCTMEELATTDATPRWMQVFIYKDRSFTKEFCRRADTAGFDALVLTIDNQIPSKRERDLRNGFSIPPSFGLIGYAAMILKYKWFWRMRNTLGTMTFGNYVRPGQASNLSALAAQMTELLDPGMTWADVEWLRRIWKKPLLIKGILHPEDAQKAIDLGVDGIIVSNHGGRQLDGAIASINALPDVIGKVGGQIPVLMDGGVRRGSDVVKALSLGATACLIGRPQLWGVATAGQAGVERILDIYSREIDMAMGLCGASDISELTPNLILKKVM